VPDENDYLTKAIGDADDRFEADGATRYTVGDALDDYLENFTGKSREKTRHTIDRHIRPVLGERRVCELTTAELRKFQTDLANRKSVYRANKGGIAMPRPDDGGSIRRGKANANRIFTPLKAALNRAFNDGRVPDDTAWRRVKPFAKVSVARVRYFTKLEISSLLGSADAWFTQ
jgi:hypothetical protein